MRPAALVAAVLVASACRPNVAAPVDGTLAFEPSELALGDVYEGHRRPGELDLVLSSRSPCTRIELSLPSGFAVDEGATLSLSGGERRTLTLRPPATGLGEHRGTVTATGCGLEATATLSAKLVPRPACTSGTSCRTSRFDPEQGACVEDAVADGTPCSDACLETSACRSGECRGQPKSCEDNDPCTLDVCSAGAGCQNLSASLLCPPPAQCPSACIGPTCPLGNAQLLWSLPTRDALGTPYMGLAADDAGNLYWLEKSEPNGGPFSVTLVSATPSGSVRYRRSFIHIVGTNGYLTPMIVGDVVLLSPNGFGSRALAFRISDGQLLWDQRLKLLLGVASNVTAWVDHGAALGDGSVVFPFTFAAGTSPPARTASIDVVTGRLSWSQPEEHILWSVAADEERNIYADPKGAQVFSRDRTGKLRFSAAVDTVNAISMGRVYSGAEAANVSDGKLAYRFGGLGYPYAVGPNVGVRSPDARKLDVFRTADGSTRGTIDLGTSVAQDVTLTEGDHVLLVSGGAGELPVLRGFDADAVQQFACRLPGMGPYAGPGVLRDGRYYVLEQPTTDGPGTLRAFLVAGQSIATRGWATGDATPARSRRPATGP